MPVNTPFKQEQTGSRQGQAIQVNTQQVTQILRNGPFGNGNLIKGISIAPGTLLVNHGLGRAYQGFVVVRYQVTAGTTPGAIVEVSDPGTLGITVDPTLQILLGSINNAVIDVWFF